MSYLLLVLSLSVAVAAAEGPERQCLTGHPNRAFHADAVEKLAEPSTFLGRYQAQKFAPQCQRQWRTLDQFVAEFRDYFRWGIQRSCIEQAMLEIPNLNQPPTSRATCADDDSTFSGTTTSGRNDQCITSAMVDYVHWAINTGLDCMNSIADAPIDAELLFKKIYRESKFGYYLTNDNGRGLGQLTSIALEDLALPNSRGYHYVQRALASDKCADFHGVLSRPVEFHGPNNIARSCQLLNPINGLGRNVFFSLALFSFYRDRLLKEWSPRGFTSVEKINYVALVAYGRNGPARTRTVMRVLTSRHSMEELNAMPMDEFIQEVRTVSPYVNEIEASYARLKPKISGRESCSGLRNF